jgi:hypothetical protein
MVFLGLPSSCIYFLLQDLQIIGIIDIKQNEEIANSDIKCTFKKIHIGAEMHLSVLCNYLCF